jgi:hypothetical protein
MIWKVGILTALIAALAIAFSPTNGLRVVGVVDKRCVEDRCTVHDERLKKDTVKIGYGLRAVHAEWFEASKKDFPFAYSSVDGGCVIMPDSPKYAKVKYCAQCRVKEREFSEQHKWPATPN